MQNPFLRGYFEVLHDTIGLKVVSRNHGNSAVRPKNTGKWKRDIELTDFAILDPGRQLRNHFLSQIPSVVDPPCNLDRQPRIAILNRLVDSGRHLLNANALATVIQRTIGINVPVVTFENKTFLEQVHFFMETDVLLSPHGAQLTGIAFMPDGASLLEFFPRDYLVPDYFGSLAAAVGVNHSFFYLGDNAIPQKERFHYMKGNITTKSVAQCPDTAKVMAAVADIVQHWRPHCSAASMIGESKAALLHEKKNKIEAQRALPSYSDHGPTIDVISTGSIRRPKLQDAQASSIGSHRFVRQFFRVTEKDDTDRACHTSLTKDQLQQVVMFCNDTDGQSSESNLIRKELFHPRNHIGWMCAQKRPIDGLHIALERYKTNSLPDYLVLVDDDTYVNVDALAATLKESYPADEPHVITGCGFIWPKQFDFAFPVFGFGSTLTRATIEKLMKPINCDAMHKDEFTRLSCWRLEQNLMGEKRFFREGMSVGDLMYAYSSELPFTGVATWQGTTGFCFHREHAIAYFFNFYHVAVSEGSLHGTEAPNDQLRVDHSYAKVAGDDECLNIHGKCGVDSRFCHKVKPRQIEAMYKTQQLALAIDGVQSNITDISELHPTVAKAVIYDEPTIDVIAVGSMLRQDLLDSQSRTFGSHRFVRNFFPITERNDTDANCYTDFSEDQLQKVLDFCSNGVGQSRESNLFRTDLFGPTKQSGWMCAQKRPIDGLHMALQMYKAEKSMPDYLMIIDDDTYLNIDALSETFRELYSPSANHLVAGCTYMRPRRLHFIFPIGGVGSILTRATIEKVMQPIHCNATTERDEFTRWACWRLDQNHVGEKQFFRDGMSVGDLMYAYSAGLPFTGVEKWTDAGYCFHSDHTLGYFFNYYHVGVPNGELKASEAPTDEVRKKHSYKRLASPEVDVFNGKGGECDHLKHKCTPESRICHYVGSDQMDSLFSKQKL